MLATAEKKHVAGFDSNAVNDEDNESEQENNEDELEVLDEPDDILLSSNTFFDPAAFSGGPKFVNPFGPEHSAVDDLIDQKSAARAKTLSLEQKKASLKRAKEEEEEEDIREPPAKQPRLSVKEENTKSAKEEDSANEDNDASPKKTDFFDFITPLLSEEVTNLTFNDLQLSRPVLKALEAMGYKTPTPIQANVIPVAITGKDICASAVTGSGKTAAFLVPIIERLLLSRSTRSAHKVLQALVLVPTRELGAQCMDFFKKIAAFTSLSSVLILGGTSSQQQQAALREGADVAIATLGRMLDHLLNSPGVGLDSLQILVLDEADRLLELGFKEQLQEIVKQCPKRRQSMLFSATMTEQVDKLASLSLHSPVRIAVDKKFDFTTTLEQEFVRLPDEEKVTREAALLSLCHSLQSAHTLVFVSFRSWTHRIFLLLKLSGLNVAELHGDLTHAKREESLFKFQKGEVDFLVCTDLAARGLDIPSVKTVINAIVPRSLCTYVHRVGRTARAGKQGRALSLLTDSDADKKLLMHINQHLQGKAKRRELAIEEIQKWRVQIREMEKDVKDVLRTERQEHELELADMEARKATNMIEHHAEIMQRPKKQWIMSESDKKRLKKESKEAAEKEDGEAEPISRKRKQESEAEFQPSAKKIKLNSPTTKKSKELQEAQRFAKAAKHRLKKHGAASMPGKKGSKIKDKSKKPKFVAKKDDKKKKKGPKPPNKNFHSKKRFKRR